MNVIEQVDGRCISLKSSMCATSTRIIGTLGFRFVFLDYNVDRGFIFIPYFIYFSYFNGLSMSFHRTPLINIFVFCALLLLYYTADAFNMQFIVNYLQLNLRYNIN